MRSSSVGDLNRSAAAVLLATILLGPVGLHADTPLLVVPAGKTTLNVAVDLPDGLKVDPSLEWRLVETVKSGATSAVQLVPKIAPDGSADAETGRLVASIAPRQGGKRPRKFQLQQESRTTDAAAFCLEDVSQTSLKLSEGDAPVLTYNHGLVTDESVPETDPRRSRACYVHPLWGLSGEVLTDDFPVDHYHHHGIFWTWPHVQIDGQEYDIWADHGGLRQRFVRWLARDVGPVAAVIGVENGWFLGDEKVMIERVWIRVYRAADEGRAVDLEFAWIPVDRPLTLWGAPGKSYGGLTIRFAPPSRTDENTVITVPSGPTEADLKETPLAWADFTSKFGKLSGPSGAALFVDPAHPDFPPTWLTRHYGPLCVGWPGVNSQTFKPGEPIRLGYRVWIHAGAVTTEALQEAYDAYAAGIKAGW